LHRDPSSGIPNAVTLSEGGKIIADKFGESGRDLRTAMIEAPDQP
jgi:hypothetical protein